MRKLDAAMSLIRYPSGALLYCEEDAPRGVYCLCSGQVKLTRSTETGRTVIVKIAGPGEVLGVETILSGDRHPTTAEAVSPCLVKCLRRGDFLQLLKESSPVCFHLAQKLSHELCQSYEQIRDMGCKILTMGRLAALLLRLMSSYGEKTALGVRLNLRLRHEELAEMIGASRETVSRLLTTLRKQGTIKIKGRTIVVVDKSALESHLSSD